MLWPITATSYEAVKACPQVLALPRWEEGGGGASGRGQGSSKSSKGAMQSPEKILSVICKMKHFH